MIIAGEASGDVLGGAVLEALVEQGWSGAAFGVAGPRLRAAGCEAIARVESLGVMGLRDVVVALPRIARVVCSVLREARARRPRVVLLIDAPDLNLRLGPRIAAMGARVVYLGAPQVWAWRSGRARAMASWVDEIACLFPFEPLCFERLGVRASFVGHPRAVEARRRRSGRAQPRRDAIVLMPGSRRGELSRHAPALRGVIHALSERRPRAPVVVPVAPTLSSAIVRRALGLEAASCVVLFEGDALEVLARARVALVASGTATVECTLMGVPHAVFYRAAPWTWRLGRLLVQVPHIAMTNLLAGARLVPEVLQEDITVARLLEALDEVARDRFLGRRLEALSDELMGPDEGVTPQARVARSIMRLAQTPRGR